MNIPSPEDCCLRARLSSRFAALVLAAMAMLLLPRCAHAQAQTRIISLTGNLNFGDVVIGQSAQRTMTISNSGNSTLTVSNIIGPAQPVILLGGYSVEWSGSIAPGRSQDVTVTFAPGGIAALDNTNPVDYPGNLEVVSDATSGTNEIQVSGTGILQQFASRIISVATNLDFGRTPIGLEPLFDLVIADKGDSDLTISNINLPDGFSTLVPAFGGPGYIAGNITNLTIFAHGQTNVPVVFTPTTVLHYGGTAIIDSDATGGKAEFTVSGDGVYPTGHYIGLFFPGTGLFSSGNTNAAFGNSGYVSASFAANGSFSGMLLLAGARQPFSGRLSPSGTFSGLITQLVPAGGNILGVSFQVTDESVYGVISNSDMWSSDLFAVRASRKVELPRPPGELPPGNYKFRIAGSTNSLLAPTNDGVGTIHLTDSGAAHLGGTLGDGTPFSQNTILARVTLLPFYASLYHSQGAVLGWINCQVVPTNLFPIPLTNRPPPLPRPQMQQGHPAPGVSSTFQGTNRIFGSLNWFKPAQIDSNYSNGFSFQTTVSGPTD